MFTDLLFLTGLIDDKHTSRSAALHSNASLDDKTESSETMDSKRGSLDDGTSELNERKNAAEVIQRRSFSDMDLFSSSAVERRNTSLPELSLSHPKSVVGSGTSLVSGCSEKSSVSNMGSLHELVDSIVSLSALKALVVIIKSNRFLDTILSYQAVESLNKPNLVPKSSSHLGTTDLRSFRSEPQGDRGPGPSPKDCSDVDYPDEAMVEVFQSVIACMVKCSILPSPIKQVVRVGELERAQTVLLNQAISRQGETTEREDSKKCMYY